MTRTMRALWMLLLAVAIGACGGGGGGVGGVGEGGTGSFASGPISGFGSVIVNDVHFDDAKADIEDDDGARLAPDALRLGQVAEIESGPITTKGGVQIAVASSIRIASALVGEVDAVRPQLTVLGQTVTTNDDTVFDDALAGGIAALKAGDVVEVHGWFDAADGSYVATRIERRAKAPARFKVRGLVSEVNLRDRTFRIANQEFVVSAGLELPAVGDRVRVEVLTARSDGRWVVVDGSEAAVQLPDAEEAKIRGLVTRFDSKTSFDVEGAPVQTAPGTEFPKGSDGLKLGAIVVVEGPVQRGVLRAEKVRVVAADEKSELDLQGKVFHLKRKLRTFTLRGVPVEYDDATRFDHGTEADLANRVRVRVRGTLSADRTKLVAERVRFLD